VAIAIFLSTLKIIENIEFLTLMLRPFYMRTLSLRAGTDEHPDHRQQFLTRMLSMLISFPLFQKFTLWLGTDAFAQGTHPELMRTLSIRISSLRVCLA
jgi:hypothetical protein